MNTDEGSECFMTGFVSAQAENKGPAHSMDDESVINELLSNLEGGAAALPGEYRYIQAGNWRGKTILTIRQP